MWTLLTRRPATVETEGRAYLVRPPSMYAVLSCVALYLPAIREVRAAFVASGKPLDAEGRAALEDLFLGMPDLARLVLSACVDGPIPDRDLRPVFKAALSLVDADAVLSTIDLDALCAPVSEDAIPAPRDPAAVDRFELAAHRIAIAYGATPHAVLAEWPADSFVSAGRALRMLESPAGVEPPDERD
ncbi:MAG: hypothetical protein ABFD84_11195, partial [Candidatus Polarisedimenticolia bacterium]